MTSHNFREVAKKLEAELKEQGWSYYEFARRVAGQYILKSGKDTLNEADLRHIDRTAMMFIDLLEPIDEELAQEFYEFYDNI